MRRLLFLLLVALIIFRVLSLGSSSLDGKTVRLSGTLTSEPREYGESYLINLKGFSFFIPRDTSISYGSHVVVEGTVKESNKLEKVKLISTKESFAPLVLFRKKVLETIKSSLPEPESSLLAGTALGAPNIPKAFLNSLRNTGTSHVVVASGGNLAILAGFLESIMPKFLKRRNFIFVNAIILTLYAILTGFGSPIVRGLVMWLSISLSQLTGRVIRPWKALLFSASLMILINPSWLFDVSFQLSFGATAAIILLATPIQKKVKRIIKLPFLAEAFSVSVAAQVGILPISIFVFKEVQLLSPFWNTLVLWVVPYITVLGLFGSLVAIVSVTIAKVIFLLSFPFAWYFVKVITLI